MKLSRLESGRRVRKHLAYDLEWVPSTLEVRIVGVYDERGYRSYPTVEGFLDNELNSENRGRWFYAHAGGMYDFQFVLKALLKKRGYYVESIDAKFSGSSAIIVKVHRGKNCWTFIDSFWLLREKLAVIGEWIGVRKGEGKLDGMNEAEKKEWYRSVPIAELRTYNERDCFILYEAIDQMQSAMLEMGGQLQMTQAASAMNLFRRVYLKADMPTNFFVNERIRLAYFASRVEVFNKKCYDASYYDINSSFPYAMTMPCPGRFIGNKRALPSGGIYFADVTIEVAEGYLPPIPTRIAGRLFFPIGRWRTWLSSVDVELLLRDGGRIEKVHEVYHFEPFYDLAAYAQDLFNKRKNAGEGFLKVAYKLMLNSLYGKFAESPYKTSLMIDPHPNKIKRGVDEMLMPGLWLVERKVPIPHMHVPISAHVTALARKTLFDYISLCKDVHYCDTDGFSTTEELEMSLGKELGALKLEKKISEGDFVMPKLYRLQGKILKPDGWKDIAEEEDRGVKSKGFSRLSVEDFLKLKAGEEIERVRMRRIREQSREVGRSWKMSSDKSNPFGTVRYEPREDMITKRLNLADMVPKRKFQENGDTRPWHIRELEVLR